jgi:ribosomal-protein-alanine N-acetyltransferase
MPADALPLFEPFPVLRQAPVLLRQIKPSDQLAVFQGLSDPRVIRYYGVEYHALTDTQAQMDWYQDLLRKGSGIWWAITTETADGLIGTCGLYNIQHQHRKAELGYWLLPDYWGRGIMRPALEAVCAYGFEKLNLHRLEAYVETQNAASARLLQKLGFAHEGTLHESEIKHGNFISLDIYARRQAAAVTGG